MKKKRKKIDYNKERENIHFLRPSISDGENGAIIIKNGSIQNALFERQDMKREVGWSNFDLYYPDCKNKHTIFDIPGSREISYCPECDLAKRSEYTQFVTHDCRGVRRNCVGVTFDSICTAFVGDEHFTVGVVGYTLFFIVDKEIVKEYQPIFSPIGEFWEHEDGKQVFYGEIEFDYYHSVRFKVKHIIPFVNAIEFNYKGDRYCIVFGDRVNFGTDMNDWASKLEKIYGKKRAHLLEGYLNSHLHDVAIKTLYDKEEDKIVTPSFRRAAAVVCKKYNIDDILNYSDKFRSLEEVVDYLNDYVGTDRFQIKVVYM